MALFFCKVKESIVISKISNEIKVIIVNKVDYLKTIIN